MRVLFWYCEKFDRKPAMKTLEDAPAAEASANASTVVAFVHIEPSDVDSDSSAETKLVKNAKWLARKWDIKRIVLHSFTHLGEAKAEPDAARALMNRAHHFTEMISPLVIFLSSSGVSLNTALGVPAAAQISSNFDRSSSINVFNGLR